MSKRRVILVGAGHAHLHVARHAGAFAARDTELVLVDPGDFWYSGLATGLLGGAYEAADDRIDAEALINRYGGRFIRNRAVGLTPSERRVQFASGQSMPYDAISWNIGSRVATDIPGSDSPHVWTVKPIANLWRLRKHVESIEPEKPLSITVIGGGASACEVAANMNALFRRCEKQAQIRLLSRSRSLLPNFSTGAGKRLCRVLRSRGVDVRFDSEVARIESTHLLLTEGSRFSSDLVIVATGLVPPPEISNLPLPVKEREGLQVTPELHSPADPLVFGAGDCIAFANRSLPKLGVFGVRQAPVLLYNLLATLDGKPLHEYRPQKHALSILNLGDGTGLATWWHLWLHGKCMLRLKNHLDQRFLSRYRLISECGEDCQTGV